MFRRFVIGTAIVGGATVATGFTMEYHPTLRKSVASSKSNLPKKLYPILGNNFKREFLQENRNTYGGVDDILLNTNHDTLVEIAPQLNFNIMKYLPLERHTPELVDHCVDIKDVSECSILTDKLKDYLIEHREKLKVVNVKCLKEFIKSVDNDL